LNAEIFMLNPMFENVPPASVISSVGADPGEVPVFLDQGRLSFSGTDPVPEGEAMANATVFITAHDRPNLIEVELSDAATLGELHDLLAAAGIKVDGETFIFVDEAEEHEQGERHQPLRQFRHGSRIHICRCRRIDVTVNYLNKSERHEFAPGARVRSVKEFAVRKFGLSPKDAAEHVLQICHSAKRPPSDTPLTELLRDSGCALCFDLVPEKRVEGCDDYTACAR
jgi:hypothetical protein